MKTLDAASHFQNRPVLVTGAKGFIGSFLTEQLVAWGAEVHALVRPSAYPDLAVLLPFLSKLQIHWADLADPQALGRALGALRGKKDVIVFHLAAQSHVNESTNRPTETVLSNIVGTLNLLQALVDKEIDVFKISLAGSSEEYGQMDPERRKDYERDAQDAVLLNERTPLNPRSVYATSKVASNLLGLNYHGSHGLPVVITRLVNTYGPRQHPRHITGAVITRALSQERLEMPLAPVRRDFLYVEDGVCAHVHSALFGNAGETYVYGSGRSIAVADWAKLILRRGESLGFWGPRALQVLPEAAPSARSGFPATVADARKIQGISGWEPRHSWEEGIDRAIAWYAENRTRWQAVVQPLGENPLRKAS